MVGNLLGVTLLVLIYTFTNINLVAKKNKCLRNQIDDSVVATVVNTTNGQITFAFDGLTCTIPLTTANYAQPGLNVYIFRSETGKCDTNKHDDDCEEDILAFNMLFTMLGGAVMGMALGCCFPKYVCTKCQQINRNTPPLDL